MTAIKKSFLKGETLGSQEFFQNRGKILEELRQLVCNDSDALRAILERDHAHAFSKERVENKNEKRKWALFLKYSNERDFEFEQLSLMEFRKLFLLSRNA